MARTYMPIEQAAIVSYNLALKDIECHPDRSINVCSKSLF
jgi:hypothetical protein